MNRHRYLTFTSSSPVQVHCDPDESIVDYHHIREVIRPDSPMTQPTGQPLFYEATWFGKYLSQFWDARLVYQCRWPGCHVMTTTCHSIEAHVRNAHLGPKNDGDGDEGMEGDDHEEEFYYTEIEVGVTSPPPTLSYRDVARPPHEDHEYQRTVSQVAGPISIPKTNFSWPVSAAISPSSNQKQIKLSVSAPIAKLPSSPSRRIRGETKKCRKVYGMEHRELWCTQCKWKKACTRFSD